jgi:hypothetical protein
MFEGVEERGGEGMARDGEATKQGSIWLMSLAKEKKTVPWWICLEIPHHFYTTPKAAA